MAELIGEVFLYAVGTILALFALSLFGQVAGIAWIVESNKWRDICKAESLIHEYRRNRKDYILWKDAQNKLTVQEWISVKERLPKPFVSVLVQMPEEAPCPTVREGFITDKGIWHSAWYDREPDEVTHWMLMPEPLKGE